MAAGLPLAVDDHSQSRWHLALGVFTLLACLALPAAAIAQGFHGVFSRDGWDAWAVGDSGVYYRTVDRGISWSKGTVGSTRLRDVAAVGYTVVTVGDSGKIWVSTNSGRDWALTVAPGATELRSVSMPDLLTAYAVGVSGVILKSADGGATWSPLTSGTAQRLNAVRFVDASVGWAVGENGTVLSTVDGGATWNPVALGTSNALLGVDQSGASVWVVGARGTAFHSVNAGASFDPVDLELDAHSDVRGVAHESATSVVLVGGGGFIRRSTDGGQTWTFPIHGMHAPMSDVYFLGSVGYAANSRNRTVMATIDGGVTWSMPIGTTTNRAWANKQNIASSRGNTIALNPFHSNTMYCASGNTVWRSENDGENWSSFRTIVGLPHPVNVIHAFIVSPKDSNVLVAAVEGLMMNGGDRIIRSTDHGMTWTVRLFHDYGAYGIPLEIDPDHPDTMYFGGDSDQLYRSTDGGATWGPWSSTVFRSPCDIVVVPGASNTILVGDGVTGVGEADLYKSTDGGLTFDVQWTSAPSVASEVPGMAGSRLRKNAAFGTNWPDGGVRRSLDYGETWQQVNNLNSAWGMGVALDDPNVVLFGRYSGGTSPMSIDGGNSFTTVNLAGTNYGIYMRDRATLLAQQSGNISKMQFTYTYTPATAQSATLSAPNGGESWDAYSTREITWLASGIPMVRLDYRIAPGEPWQPIAEVPGYYGSHQWIVPNTPTTEAKVRVVDAWDPAPEDSSNATFTIVGTVSVADALPRFELAQNRPNPFTGTTQIAYSLPFETDVSVEVFDLQGQRVAQLVSGRQGPGHHAVSFGRGARDARGGRLGSLPSGVYYYRLRAGSFATTRKMLYLR